MRKLITILSVVTFLFVGALFITAQPTQASTRLIAQIQAGAPTPSAPDGTWLTDPDVTFAGKTASRSASLFNWVLINYKWNYDSNKTLEGFWARIRNIVYAFLILLIMVSAFSMIISGGQSMSAPTFLRKFVSVLFLITFSFALIRFFYQFTDTITGFFVRNPDGDIISSRDLFNMSFGYTEFLGYRRYGPQFDESAFVSLLLVKITAVTYYVMAGILLVRKIILWFFITVSPIYPVLMMYFPVRNTAKIWLGEFFRWLLYQPLFTIFLYGLVVLYRADLNTLPFNFYAGGTKPIVYPTAINILLGGPGQRLSIDNSINYTDTFAEYLIALIMVWVVIFLPFLLLRIFLDYLSNMSFKPGGGSGYLSNAWNYILNKDRMMINNPTSIGGPKNPPPGGGPTGAAMAIPFRSGAAREIIQQVSQPFSSGASRSVNNPTSTATTTSNTTHITNNTSTSSVTNAPVSTKISNVASSVTNTPTTINQTAGRFTLDKTSQQTLKLVSFPLPTLKDIAKFETTQLSRDTQRHHEVSKVKSTLEKIANPYTITDTNERQQFSELREKLVQQKLKGDNVATNILNAANTVQSSNQQSRATTNISNQQLTQLHQSLSQASQAGNTTATNILNMAKTTSKTTNTSSQMNETLEKIAHPEKVTDSKEKEKFTNLKQTLEKESQAGNPVSTQVLNAAKQTDKKIEAKPVSVAPAVSLPKTNTIQSVNLEDYENVKKMWNESYSKMGVPKSIDKPNRTRQEWIRDDMNKINETINELISQDQTKVQQGMKEVSTLLPFLMMGGFSQQEVVAYLKAKQVAGQEVLKQISTTKTTEEDTLLETRRHHAVGQRTMTEHMEEVEEKDKKTEQKTQEVIQQRSEIMVPVGMKQQAPAQEPEDESDLVSALRHAKTNQMGHLEMGAEMPSYEEEENYMPETESITPSKAEIKQQNTSTDTMNLVNFAIPTIQDVAKFETTPLTNDETVKDEVNNLTTTLRKIAHPETITDEAEKAHFSEIHDKLSAAKDQGDAVAESVLTSAQSLGAIETPDRENIEKLHITPRKENKVQTVNLEDYENVRKMWVDSYGNMTLPQSTDKPNRTRQEWIKDDLSQIDQTVNKLISQDEAQVQEGMKEVAKILPVLLLGGFSNEEVIAYLKAKQSAGQQVLRELEETQAQGITQDTLLAARRATHQASRQMEASSEESEEAFVPESPVAFPKAEIKLDNTSGETMNLVSFPIPTMRDVAKFETGKLKKDEASVEEVKQVEETLTKLANPDSIADETEKSHFKDIREKLQTAKNNGDVVAGAVLTASEAIDTVASPDAEEKLKDLAIPMAEENKVQVVSLDDYENVKRLFVDSYRNSDVPFSLDKQDRDRKGWIDDDITQIQETLDLLLSTDPDKKKEGMKKVREILPLLLIGGFSESEIIAYLKAKLEAAKQVLDELTTGEKESFDTFVEVENTPSSEENTQMADLPDAFTQESESEPASGKEVKDEEQKEN